MAQQDALRKLFPPTPAGYVTDVARLLDPATVSRLDSLAIRLRAVTGAEMAIVTLPTIGDRSAAEVALEIGRVWKVGAKAEVGDARHNAGLVLLLVPRARDGTQAGHVRIEVGQGLEGIVTDLQSSRVRDLMVPALRSGDYGQGLETGAKALASIIVQGMGIRDSSLAQPDQVSQPETGRKIPTRIILIAVIVIWILLFNAKRRGGGWLRGVGPWIGGGSWGGGGGGFGGGGGGGFGGFGGGGGFSGGGSGGDF